MVIVFTIGYFGIGVIGIVSKNSFKVLEVVGIPLIVFFITVLFYFLVGIPSIDYDRVGPVLEVYKNREVVRSIIVIILDVGIGIVNYFFLAHQTNLILNLCIVETNPIIIELKDFILVAQIITKD